MRRPRLSFLVFLTGAFLSVSPLLGQSPVALVTRRLPPTEQLPPVSPRRLLTLAEVEGLALIHNPSLARAAAQIISAEGDWVQNGLAPNPIISIGEQQVGSRGIAEQDGISIQQEIVTGRKLLLNREVASRNTEIRRQQW